MDLLTDTVPDTWRRIPLGDACDVQSGPSGSSHRSTGQTSIHHQTVKPKNLREHRIMAGKASLVEYRADADMERYRLSAGDIVCLRIGRSRRHAVVDHAYEGWLFDTGLLRLRPRAELTTGYLDHYLRQPGAQAWLASHISGTAVPTLNSSDLRALPLLLPPFETQKEIAAVLDAFDEKVEAHLEISRAAARLRDALAPALVTGRLSPPVPGHRKNDGRASSGD